MESLHLGALPRRRRWFDALVRSLTALGGATVVAVIATMLFFLLQAVAPLFAPAFIGAPDADAALALPPGEVRLLHVNESAEAAVRIDADGEMWIFDLNDGRTLASLWLGHSITAAKPALLASNLYGVLDGANRLWLVETTYHLSFRRGVRRLQPSINVLWGGNAVQLDDIVDYDLAMQGARGRLLVAALSPGALDILTFPNPSAAASPANGSTERLAVAGDPEKVLFGPRGDWLFTVGGQGPSIDLRRPANFPTAASQILAGIADASGVTPLLGRLSLLIPGADNSLTQWSLSQAGGRPGFRQTQVHQLAAPARTILAERRRKGFAVLDEAGNFYLGHATSGRILAQRRVSFADGAALALSPRADFLLALEHSGTLRRLPLSNAHPEVSWATLFAKVQYEGYEEPVHSWQSSSADPAFEPKFSLTPLLFGTLKAAFYAMLFAAPIALMGAAYTACFMAPAMRRWVKPAIEMMAALPTVVLGFLAGLWLAPLIEANLATTLAIGLVVPGGMLLFAWLWRWLAEDVKARCDGWQALIAIAPMMGLTFAAIEIGPLIESAWLGGDAKAWLLEAHGLDYDQRNALIVGLAMGVAVIPLIFAIAEDAIHAVPAHLADGSLALGASRWQTFSRVILLTASPGIFSGLIIGLGRAVGETMIVLMATGNTAIMDFNILSGLRTFAANMAVELPESEVGSTHYRLLYLTALLLFVMTFAFNTVGDLVRERLRERFGHL